MALDNEPQNRNFWKAIGSLTANVKWLIEAVKRLEGRLDDTNDRIDRGLKENNDRLDDTNDRIDRGRTETNDRIDQGQQRQDRRWTETNERMDRNFERLDRKIDRVTYVIIAFGTGILGTIIGLVVMLATRD